MNDSSRVNVLPSCDTSTFTLAEADRTGLNDRRYEMPWAVNGVSEETVAVMPEMSDFTPGNRTRSAGGVGKARTAMSS